MNIRVSDDHEVTLIKVGINDENSVAVSQLQTITVSKKIVEQSFLFKLNQNAIKTGKYYCFVIASDGEKETKSYRGIIINEPSKIITGFITCEQNSNTSNLHHYNALSEKQGVKSYTGLLKVGAFLPSAQSLLTYYYNGDAKAYQVPQFSEVWNMNAQVKSVARNDQQFILIKGDDYISSYHIADYSAFKSYYEPSFTYHPACAAAGTNLFCSFNMMSNQTASNKLIVYDLNTSMILNELVTNNEVYAIQQLQNNRFILQLVNTLNQHQVALYDAETNHMNVVYTSVNPIKSILRINELSVLIHSAVGLGLLNLQSNSFQLIITNSNINCFDLNNISNELFVVAGSQLQKYNLGGQMLSSINLDHQPISLHLTYNR